MNSRHQDRDSDGPFRPGKAAKEIHLVGVVKRNCPERRSTTDFPFGFLIDRFVDGTQLGDRVLAADASHDKGCFSSPTSTLRTVDEPVLRALVPRPGS